MTNINLGVGIQDNTKQGLSSAYNNVTAMTNKLAKQLVLEVGIKFPDISSRVQNLEKEFRAANNAIGKFEFLGERFDKRGRSIGTMSMDFKGLKGNLSLDEINRVLPQLKDLREGIRSGAIKSVDILGIGGEKELKNLDRTIQKLTTYKETYEYVIRTANKRNTQLTSEAASIGRVNKQLEKEEKAKREIAAIDKQLDANAKSDKSEKAKLEEEVRLLSMKVKFLREQDKLAGIPQATPSAELEQTQQRLNQVKAIQRLNTLYNTQNGILTRLRNVAGQYFSLQGIIRFGQKVAEITGYYQKQQIALEGILGSATKAQSAINQLKQKALESPFMVKQLVTYTKQLAAFGIEYDNLIPTVSKLADVSVGLGVDMDRIILAYGQVKSATVLRGQELRQFTEAGIPMVEELAKKFTALNGELVTTADIFDLISKRQVSFDMVQKVMSDLTSEGGKFYKMQENITNTLAGQIEKLKDIWDAELNRIGEESGNVFTGIVKFLQQIVKNIKSVSWAMMVMIPTSYIVREFARIKMEFMKLNAAQQAQAGNMWKHAFKMGSLLRGIGGLAITAGLGIAVGLIAKAVDNATRLRKELEKVGEAFDKETTKMISGLDSLTKKITAANIGTKEYNDAVETLATNYGDFISIDIIKALQYQGDAAHQTAMEFATIAENVKAAIKELQQFKELEAKKETVKEAFVKDKTSTAFFQNQLDYRVKYSDSTKAAFKEKYGRDGEGYELVSFWDEEFDNAVKEFANAPIHSKDKFNEIFSEIIEDTFSGISESDKKEALRAGWMAVENKTTSIFSPDTLQELIDARNRVQNSDYYKIDNALKKVDLSKVTGTPLEKYAENEKAYRAVLTKVGKEGEDTIQSIMKNIVDKEKKSLESKEGGIEKIKKISDAYSELNNVLKDETKTPLEVANAFKNLYETIGNVTRKHEITQISDWYKKNVGLLTEDQYTLANRMAANQTFKYKKVEVDGSEKSLQDYFDKFNPAHSSNINKTKDQIADAIITEYQSLESELKKHPNEGKGSVFEDDMKYVKEKMEVLKTLAGKQYYDVDLSSKKGGGNKNKYEKIRTTDFFDEWLSLITKAEDDMKKIVGVTGYTDELGNFVNQLSEKNYLRGFFEKDGNPFEDIFAKMTDVGITEFLPDFNQETLKNIFREAGWEEGKEISIPDFKAMYETVVNTIGDQVIAGLKTKRDQYAQGTSERNSLEAEIDMWQEAQAKYVKTMTTRWGGDEIEKKIDAAIRELTGINSNLEKVNKQRALYDRISAASNPLLATKYIYQKDAVPYAFDMSHMQKEHLLGMLNSEGGKGLAETKAGDSLMRLLKPGALNVQNLAFLTDIVHDLENQASAKIITNADGTTIENSEQFKAVTSQVTNVINQLIESIIKEYEDLSKYKTGELKISDEIITAATNFKTAIETINAALKDGNIKDTQADNMKIGATQQYYDSVVKSLGGSETPDWIKNMFGDKDAFGGVSGSGRFMKGLSGSNSLLDMVIQSKTAGINKQYAEGVFGEVGSADAMQGAADKLAGAASSAAGSIAMVDAIIKAVYQAINAVVELGKGILETDAKVNNELNLRKGTNGKLYDKDGNINIDDNYYEKQNRREIANQALDTIGHFNDHVMGGWEKLKSGDVLGAVTETVMSIADLIGDIVGTKDTQIQHQQDALVRSNEDLARSMEGLEDALEDAAGIDKFDVQSQQIANLQQQKANAEMLLEWENQKKNGDAAKAQDYTDQAVEAQRQIDEIMDNIQTEVLGTADQLASTLTDPLVDAFRNGENAARAWRDAVKSYVSDVLKDILMTKVVAPKIQEILDQFMGDNTDSDDILSLFKDEDKVGGLVDSLNDVGTGLIDDFNNLPSSIKDLIGFNSEQSSLSGGISGITEDTARQLEGLANSMLMQQIIGNSHLASMSSHLIATIQISWFNGMLEQAKATRIAAENLDRAISDMRNGIRPMSVTMV